MKLSPFLTVAGVAQNHLTLNVSHFAYQRAARAYKVFSACPSQF